jgi:signal transduction histidine kinase
VTLLRTDLEQSGRSPQPTLDRLPWLLAQVQRAGLPVTLTIRGRPHPLSATVELNAFRIVQEALTNILKHAGPTEATVSLEYEGDHLNLEVRNRGRVRGRGWGSSPRPSVGYGLISMQQRAGMLGGELVAKPTPDHGFVVSARLPMEDSDRRFAPDPAEKPRDDPARRPVEGGVR